MPEFSVEVQKLGKNFGAVRALREISFRVRTGSYFVLLGPSGGGKTTILRLIGGFERPDRGQIRLMGREVTGLPPNERDSSMVFQNYALFPHMNVERNVGYGLKLRKLPRKEVHQRVENMLELVGLQGLNARMPNELSGGQQQRVQLARSLVLDTAILLLDEPLASLDANLRKEMCLELKHIQERVGITFLHVTHNQEEAMTIADRIAVIADGDLIEENTPREIYENPITSFTAEFIGENNLLAGRVTEVRGEIATVDLGFAKIVVPAAGNEVTPGTEVKVSLRSEKLFLISDRSKSQDMESIEGTFMEQVFLGLTVNHLVSLPNGQGILLRRISDGRADALEPGNKVVVSWKRGDARLHTG
ncbi:MAG: ABC transporter ATP-binding protein [SAR324 cluster bacterium]|nr:ABC transporter ATP-binding protein [SAR324 cluster bacterium]